MGYRRSSLALALALVFVCLLHGCAGQPTSALVPMPPQESVVSTRPASPPAQPAQSEDLDRLLNLATDPAAAKNAVAQIRPQALREAAQLVTIQTAMAWRYGQLIQASEHHAAILDKAFNFAPLMVTQGNALIMPPVLTRAGASLRIEDNQAATAASTSYELLEDARYVSVAPGWRWYLMADTFPKPETPNPSVLPQNAEERKIWQEAVREAWQLGLEQADQLYVDNVSRMVRDYRGIMLYHLLTAQHLLTGVQTASSDLGTHISDTNKMHLGQKVYRITAPAKFKAPGSSLSGTTGGLVAKDTTSKPVIPPMPRMSPTPRTPAISPVVSPAPRPIPAPPVVQAALHPVSLPQQAASETRNFDYDVSGSSSLKPVQVYDDGQKTFVRMPQTITASAMPVFIVRQQGKDTVVSYRINGETLVVDDVFSEAILLFGVGGNQQRVTLRKL